MTSLRQMTSCLLSLILQLTYFQSSQINRFYISSTPTLLAHHTGEAEFQPKMTITMSYRVHSLLQTADVDQCLISVSIYYFVSRVETNTTPVYLKTSLLVIFMTTRSSELLDCCLSWLEGLTTSVTLLVVPASLVYQWLDEIETNWRGGLHPILSYGRTSVPNVDELSKGEMATLKFPDTLQYLLDQQDPKEKQAVILTSYETHRSRTLPEELKDIEASLGITQEPHTQSEQSMLSWGRAELRRWQYLPRIVFGTSRRRHTMPVTRKPTWLSFTRHV
ncbi:unnamed protein product [Penicillium bialowiezense]